METNALLFAVLKRDEIEPTFDRMAAERVHDYHTPKTRADFYQCVNHPTFYPFFLANYAERLLGEGA